MEMIWILFYQESRGDLRGEQYVQVAFISHLTYSQELLQKDLICPVQNLTSSAMSVDFISDVIEVQAILLLSILTAERNLTVDEFDTWEFFVLKTLRLYSLDGLLLKR